MAACAEPIAVESDEEKVPSPRKGRGGKKRPRNQAASASQKRGGKQTGAQEVVDLEQHEEAVPFSVTAGLEAQAKEEWACAACTYLNQVALDKCSMCQELRNKAGGPSSSLHPAAPNPAGKDATPLLVASEQEAASTRVEVCPDLDSKCKHCEDEFAGDKLSSLDLCGHRFCQTCLEGHVKGRMADRPAAEEATVADVLSSLVCPYSNCGRPLSRRDVTGVAGVKGVAGYDAWLAPLLRRLLMTADANSSTLLCQQDGCQANGSTCHSVIGLKSLRIVQVRGLLRLRGLETKGRAPDCIKRLQAAVGLLTNSTEWHICTKCGYVYCSTCLAELSRSPEIAPIGRHLCPQEQVLLVARHLAALEGAYQALCGPASPPANGAAERSLEKLRDLAKGRKRAKVAVPQSRAPGGSGTVWAKGTGFGGAGNDRWGYTPPAAAGPSAAELAAQAAERKADDSLRSAADGLTGCLSGSIALAAGGGVMPAVSLPACSLLLSGSLARILRTLLQNDSLLDVSGRRDLYVALLQLLRALASHADLLPLLCQAPPAEDRAPPGGASAVVQQQEEEEVVLAGLEKLYQQAKFLLQSAVSGVEDDGDGLDVGLACEVRDVYELVKGSTERWQAMQPAKEPLPEPAMKAKSEAEQASASQPRARTRQGAKAEAEAAKGDKEKGKAKIEEGGPAVNSAAEATAYKAALKPLQFAMCDLKGSSGNYDHYFRGELNKAIDKAGVHAQKRMLRVSKELASLATTLPLEWESSIHLRVDQERMDLLKALIIGPHDTPYANGLFIFDIFLPPDYPNSSPRVHFLTTGGGTVRFNPNLYNCGKVCLSLLGTWAGPGWDPSKSTLLQVLVSIQSLIFVQDPYYNEPGYEAHGPSAASEEYNAAQRRNTLQFAILPALKAPTHVFKDVLETHFRLKKRELLRQCEEWAAIKPAAIPKPSKHSQHYSMGYLMPYNHMLGTSSSKDSIADAAKAVKAELAKLQY